MSPNARFNRRVLFALVASDSEFAVELFPSLELAERALAEVLEDEPLFAGLLSIALVEDRAEPSLN